MEYISTRGSTSKVSFQDVLLSSLAEDSGLYLPESYPNLSGRLDELAELSYTDLAFQIVKAYTNDIFSEEDLHSIIDRSYRYFQHEDIAPLVDFDQFQILELFHGSTWAFKDYPLQFLGNLFSHVLEATDSRLNLLGATSGDTGSAAIYGVKGKPRMNIFMIHPENGISTIQKLQMTTIKENNVFNISISGSFDDGQRIVKAIFNDKDFCQKYNLGAVNSINWVRIMSQLVYFFYSGLNFLKENPSDPLIYSVPTGNFGNIFAGYVAKQMGLPIHKLICATNKNNILSEAINHGIYKKGDVIKTITPSIDIQVSSNFERLLFESSGRNGTLIRQKYAEFENSGEFLLEADILSNIRNLFDATEVNENEILDTINKIYRKYNYLVDPHTAVGIAAAQKTCNEKFIALGTASYKKFIPMYRDKIGIDILTPPDIEKLFTKNSIYRKLEPEIDEIKSFIVNSL